MFNLFENTFDPSKFNFYVLSNKSFKFFDNFENQRNFLCTSFGHEQIFSIYVQCFYSEYIDKEFEIKKKFEIKDKLLNYKNILKKFVLGIKPKLLRYFTVSYTSKVLLLGCYFAKNHVNYLLSTSKGKISYLHSVRNNKVYKANTIKRSSLCKLPDEYDRFDKFFYQSLIYLFPTHLFEGFHQNKNLHHNILKHYPNLQVIISEAWLSHTNINFFRALAFELYGIKTYYNEHNCIFHPFQGSYVEFLKNNVDKYLTFGWHSNDPKIISTSSLFTFEQKPKGNNLDFDILYVSYPAEVYYSHYNTAWSNCGYSAISNLGFVNSFFMQLDYKLKDRITYRGYPLDCLKSLFKFDKELILSNSLDGINYTSSYIFKGLNCRQQMSCSKIVIVDFLSTSYLESLHINIPTICFWDSKCMKLKHEYSNYFDDLIEAKIIHTSPYSAAAHLKNICDNPQIWWQSKKVQNLKNQWLTRNFGKPDILINYLLKLSKN